MKSHLRLNRKLDSLKILEVELRLDGKEILPCSSVNWGAWFSDKIHDEPDGIYISISGKYIELCKHHANHKLSFLNLFEKVYNYDN